MQYLSDEWIEAADAALSEAWAAADPDPGDDDGDQAPADTTIVYTVTGAPSGKVTYGLHFGPDGAGVSGGGVDGDPDATMALDYETAAEIARGDSSTQATFMQGRLKLGGDVTLLIRGARRLAAVGDALASLRGTTDY